MFLDRTATSVCIVKVFNMAVALATFGYPYKLDRKRDEHSGDVISSLWKFEPFPLLYVKEREDEPMPTVQAQTLQKEINGGTLEHRDPQHPVCGSLHDLNSFECIRTYMERATPFRIARTLAGQFTLVEGAEPASDNKRPAIAVESLELAVILVRAGHALLHCDGVKPHRRIILANHSYDPLQPDAKSLVAAINSDTLPISDPALWTLCTIRNRKEMKRQLDYDKLPLLLRNPRSLAWEKHKACVFTREGADGKTIDRARKLLK